MSTYNLFLELEITIDLHPLEKRLIESIRSIGCGEICSIKIQDGLPVIYQVVMHGNSVKNILDRI